MRHEFRSGMLGYIFDLKTEKPTEPGLEGFRKSALSMADMLDKPTSEWESPDAGLTYTKD